VYDEDAMAFGLGLAGGVEEDVIAIGFDHPPLIDPFF
jgi:hypothetical protein